MKTCKKLFISLLLLCIVVIGKTPVNADAAWKVHSAVHIKDNWYLGVANHGDFYYLNQNVLYKGTLKSTGSKVADLKKQFAAMPVSYRSIQVVAAYGNTLYLNADDEMSTMDVYAFDLQDKTLKKELSGMNIMEFDGKCFLINARQHSDVSPCDTYLYKATASGLKKVKHLGYTDKETFIGDYIYFGKYATLNPRNKLSICRIKKDGSCLKKLVTKSVTGKYASVYAEKITKTYCEISVSNNSNSKKYRYTYSTKNWKTVQ